MRNRGELPAHYHEERLWQIDKHIYDARSELTAEESVAVARIAKSHADGGRGIWTHQTATLLRLVQPLHYVLDGTKPCNGSRSSVISVLLREMGRREKIFWVWTQEEWLDTLCYTGLIFRERFRVSPDCRPHIMAIAYLLCDVRDFRWIRSFDQRRFAYRIFGTGPVYASVGAITDEVQSWGYKKHRLNVLLPNLMCEIFILNRSTRLEDITLELLTEIRKGGSSPSLKELVEMVSRALAIMGHLPQPLATKARMYEVGRRGAFKGVDEEWLSWSKRWHETSTMTPTNRDSVYYSLLRVGRWLAAKHPKITTPAGWTRSLAADYVAAVDRMNVGDWGNRDARYKKNFGKPLMASTKDRLLAGLRAFFFDCQEWEWIKKCFDPRRALATPRTVRTQITPAPRVIQDDIWAKLLWAGLSLTAVDLPVVGYDFEDGTPVNTYPVEMVKAMAIVWLFAGLRSDEIYRLRKGCIRRQSGDVVIATTGETLPKNSVCWLEVPVNKTSPAFTKPVDVVVGEAVVEWEKSRPEQPPYIDLKTGEIVNYLFSYRGKPIGRSYINAHLIPILCRKAGVPLADAKGDITSHRARSTIATQLYNAKEPMTLVELQEWLGHRKPSSTVYYAKITPTKLAKAYSDANYFARNIRSIDVLIDPEIVRSGAAAQGETWRYYDQGPGYCAFEFFETCPHLMACARCDFYIPKDSMKGHYIAGREGLLRMRQEMHLSNEEVAAVDGGIKALELLTEKLSETPTPAGPTPRELENKRRELPILRQENLPSKD